MFLIVIIVAVTFLYLVIGAILDRLLDYDAIGFILFWIIILPIMAAINIGRKIGDFIWERFL